MIRREMIEQLRAESYDLLENTDPELFEPRDPDQPDALERWQSMRPKPQPEPRQRSTVASVRADWDTYVDARANDVVLAQFSRGGKLYEMFVEAIGDLIGEQRERHKRALAVEIKSLRRELDATRAQIEALQGDGNKIVSWSIDRRQYRATPILPDGKLGATLDLRGLFEQFR